MRTYFLWFLMITTVVATCSCVGTITKMEITGDSNVTYAGGGKSYTLNFTKGFLTPDRLYLSWRLEGPDRNGNRAILTTDINDLEPQKIFDGDIVIHSFDTTSIVGTSATIKVKLSDWGRRYFVTQTTKNLAPFASNKIFVNTLYAALRVSSDMNDQNTAEAKLDITFSSN